MYFLVYGGILWLCGVVIVGTFVGIRVGRVWVKGWWCLVGVMLLVYLTAPHLRKLVKLVACYFPASSAVGCGGYSWTGMVGTLVGIWWVLCGYPRWEGVGEGGWCLVGIMCWEFVGICWYMIVPCGYVLWVSWVLLWVCGALVECG